MKKYIILLCIIFTYTISQGKNCNNIIIPIDTTNSKTYTAEQKDSSDDFFQELSVTWTSENTIQYSFTLRNRDCSNTYTGTAVNNNNSIKTLPNEIVYYKKKSFRITSYKEINKEYRIIIKIDTKNKNKAVVAFSSVIETEMEQECRSHQVVMLEKK